MADDFNKRKVSCKWIKLSLLAIKLKYFYLGKSSTLQNTILSEESLIEDLTGWLVSVCLQEQKFFFLLPREKQLQRKQNLQKSNYNDIFWVTYVSLLLTIYHILSVCCCLIIVRHLDFLGEFKIKGWSFYLFIAHFRVWVMLPYCKQCSILLIIAKLLLISVFVIIIHEIFRSYASRDWKMSQLKPGNVRVLFPNFAKDCICVAKIFEGW